MAKKIIKEMEIKFGPISLKVVDGKIDPTNQSSEGKEFLDKIGNVLNGGDSIEVILPNIVKTPEGLTSSPLDKEIGAGGLPEGSPEEEALETPGEEAEEHEEEAEEHEEEAEEHEEEAEEHEEEAEEHEEEKAEKKNPFVSTEDINKIANLISEDINTNNGMRFKKTK